MIITQSTDKMVIRSLELVKTFMSLVFIVLGLCILFLALTSGKFDWGLALFGLVFACCGFLLAFDIGYIHITLNKIGDSSITQRRGMRSETINFNISDIQGLEKLEYQGIGNGSGGPNDILRLKIKDIDAIDIASTRQNTAYAKVFRPYRREIEKMAKFTGINYEVKKIDMFKEVVEVLGKNDSKKLT